MAMNRFLLKKWLKMIFGKSMLHVKQTMGKNFSNQTIGGYYNDLTLKVLKNKKHFDNTNVFQTEFEDGFHYFPIAIFQYGLGAYDLFLSNSKDTGLMKGKVISAAEWALSNQEPNGGWDSFSFLYPDFKYSAMCQGEGASLLFRAYLIEKKEAYIQAAIKAIDFMLSDLCLLENDNLFLYEYMNKPFVFNGAIFASFGLFDAYLFTKEESYLSSFNKSCNALLSLRAEWDCGYWSKYDRGDSIASPFYHGLHISLLEALYKITEKEEFNLIKQRFSKYRKNIFYKVKSFFIKVNQKVKE